MLQARLRWGYNVEKNVRQGNQPERFALVGDIGGTNTRLGIMSSDGRIVERIKDLDSRRLNPEMLIDNINRLYVDCKEYFRSPDSFVGVSIAFAGLVNQTLGGMEASPHLSNYVGISFLDMLHNRLPGIHYVENDAAAACLAEYRLGAGVGAKNMIYVAVGTGIGGGLIIDGSLYRGSGGFAGEIGHIYAGSEFMCACGKSGCLEAMNSGSGIETYLSNMHLLDAYDDMGKRASGESQKCGNAVGSEWVVSVETIDRIGKNIGTGLGSVVNIMNPDTVVIGGGLSSWADDLLSPISESLRETAFGPMTKGLRVSIGSLGDQAGMLGAGLLLFDIYSAT